MTKLLIIIGGVLIIGGGVWLLLDATPATAPTPEAVVTEMPSDTSTEEVDSDDPYIGEGTATFAALIESGGSYLCTFSSSADGVVSVGDLYTDGERYRVTAETTVDGEVTTSDMINNGATTYIWSETPEGMMGMMMANDMTETVPTGADMYPSESMGVDMEQDVTYECDTWVVNESFFTPPSNVEFVDMQAMMQGAFGTMQ